MGRDNSIEVKDDLVDYSPTSRNIGLTCTPKFIGEERKRILKKERVSSKKQKKNARLLAEVKYFGML